MRLPHQADIEGPGRVRHGLPDAADFCIGTAHAGVGVAIARPRHRHIDGKDQRLDAGRLGAFKRIAHKAPILQHIELEPDRRFTVRRDLLDRTDRDSRQRHTDAGL